MNGASCSIRTREGTNFFSSFNVCLLVSIAAVWIAFAFTEQRNAATLSLLIITSVGGVLMIRSTAKYLNDSNIAILSFVFIAKLAFLLLILGALWKADLLSGSSQLDGDQERFYFQAAKFAQSGLHIASIPSLNYTGVLLVYGAVFAVFGHNPFAPALINSLATLVATLLLLRVGYAVKADRDAHDWTLGLCMVIPEVLLHDVMTSRDALAMSLLSIAVLSIACYVVGRDSDSKLSLAILAMSALILLAIVRTTALLPAIAAIVALLFLFRAGFKLAPVVVIAAAATTILVVGPKLSHTVGGYEVSYREVLSSTAINPGGQFLAAYNWNRRSIGKLLVPRSAAGAVALAIPRTIAYIVAPLPTVGFHWRTITAGEWFSWQELLITLSSLLYISLLPLALISLVNAVRNRRSYLALQIPFWVTMLAIASGTAIIHERYRVMALIFLWGCIWLGRTATRKQLLWSYLSWGVVLLAGGACAIAYKKTPCSLPMIAAQTTSTTIEAGQTTALHITAAGSGLTYQWFGGNCGFMGAPVSHSNRASITVSPPVTSSYWARVSNSCGSVDSGTVIVTVSCCATSRKTAGEGELATRRTRD